MAGDLAVIGNSGADMDHGGVRGYVSAYDIETGKLQWRFFTVPGAPGQPYENPALAIADKTWDPHRSADYKGGGTVWNAFAYDPDLNPSISARPMRHHMICGSWVRRKATPCSRQRFLRCTPIAATLPGISRPLRATTGITTPCSS